MKYLHDPVESGESAGPQQIIAHVVIFVIGFAVTEIVCAAVILEKIPCYEPDPCGAPYMCSGALCMPGPVE
jgi:hypothetical protein